MTGIKEIQEEEAWVKRLVFILLMGLSLIIGLFWLFILSDFAKEWLGTCIRC